VPLLRLSLITLLATTALAQSSGEPWYSAIRENNLVTLRTLATNGGMNARGNGGQTPLMAAASFGSLEAVSLLIAAGADPQAANEAGLTPLHLATSDPRKARVLLERGADVNKASLMGRTPLLVAAGTEGTFETVKLLIERGADVNAADASGVTPLIAAAFVDNGAVAKFLVEKGANVNARAMVGANTALMGASINGNTDLTRLLLAHKADVNAISADRGGTVKNGPVAFGYVTPLHLSVSSESPETVKLLLESGAKVNARDIRGMTPLMFAVSTDRPHLEIIRMLLARGADPTLPSMIKETSADWARKFNNPTVLSLLKLKADIVSPAEASLHKIAGPSARLPQQAVELSLPLLQRTSASVFTDGGCVACHAQPITGMAVTLARKRGWRIDEAINKSVASESARAISTLSGSIAPNLQAREGGGTPDSMLYNSLMMATAGEPASAATDTLVYYLAAKQHSGGFWVGVGGNRAPMQDGNLSRTAMAIRTLTAYMIPARKAELTRRVERAATWLARQTPMSTEDRVMQLLGLQWAGAEATLRARRTKQLTDIQLSDGGWSQTPYLSSDAYATGQALFTLHELGVPSTDPAFKRGVDYLLRTQQKDGSWYVKSRAMKIQPYFETGFPYDHDQWISETGTAWAVMALTFAAPETPAADGALRR